MNDRAYAAGTSVPVERTLGEIRNAIKRWGGDGFAYAEEPYGIRVGFRVNSRGYRLDIPSPERKDFEETETGRQRNEETILKEMEKEMRRRMRTAVTLIKASLDWAECTGKDLEEVLLGMMVLPTGETVHQAIRSQGLIEAAMAGQSLPPLSPFLLPADGGDDVATR